MIKITGYSGLDISWKTFAEDDFVVDLEGEIAENLCLAWQSWSSRVESVVDEGDGPERELSQNTVDVIGLFSKVLDVWEMRMGSSNRKLKDLRADRIFLQGPAQVLPNSLLTNSEVTMRLPEASKLQIQSATRDVGLSFRFLCKAKGGSVEAARLTETLDVVAVLEVEKSLNPWLLNRAGDQPEDLFDNVEFKDALIASVWANAGGALDAWQQLYVLACIRTCHSKKWLKANRWESEEDEEDTSDSGDEMGGAQLTLAPQALTNGR